MARKRSHEGFVLLPRDHEKYFSAATTNAITADDYDRFMKGKKEYTIEELKARIPVEYHSEIEIEVFVKQDADKLRSRNWRAWKMLPDIFDDEIDEVRNVTEQG